MKRGTSKMGSSAPRNVSSAPARPLLGKLAGKELTYSVESTNTAARNRNESSTGSQEPVTKTSEEVSAIRGGATWAIVEGPRAQDQGAKTRSLRGRHSAKAPQSHALIGQAAPQLHSLRTKLLAENYQTK